GQSGKARTVGTAPWIWDRARRRPLTCLRGQRHAVMPLNPPRCRTAAVVVRCRAVLRRAALLVIVMLSISAPAYAIDHKNLDAGRPTRLDDAHTIAAGEIEVAAGLGATVERRRCARG